MDSLSIFYDQGDDLTNEFKQVTCGFGAAYWHSLILVPRNETEMPKLQYLFSTDHFHVADALVFKTKRPIHSIHLLVTDITCIFKYSTTFENSQPKPTFVKILCDV